MTITMRGHNKGKNVAEGVILTDLGSNFVFALLFRAILKRRATLLSSQIRKLQPAVLLHTHLSVHDTFTCSWFTALLASAVSGLTAYSGCGFTALK